VFSPLLLLSHILHPPSLLHLSSSSLFNPHPIPLLLLVISPSIVEIRREKGVPPLGTRQARDVGRRKARNEWLQPASFDLAAIPPNLLSIVLVHRVEKSQVYNNTIIGP
jgi:hypothetical protein